MNSTKYKQQFDKFVEFFSKCEYLNHIIFTGSIGKLKVHKVYSCKDLFDVSETKSVEDMFNEYVDELIELTKEFESNIDGFILSITFKEFNVGYSETSWQ